MLPAINAWSAVWSRWMITTTVGASLVLVAVGAVWLLGRRRLSPHVGCWLFALVLLKAALPLEWSVSDSWARFWPQARLSAVSAPAPPSAGAAHSGASAARPSSAAFDFSGRTLAPRVEPAPALHTAASVEPLSTISLLMLAWLGVVVTLLTWLAASHVRLARWIGAAEPLDERRLRVNMAELQQQIGLSRRVRLVASDALAVPAAAGLFRPTILLPRAIEHRLDRQQLSWVLLHELAHVRRGDLWMAFFQRIVTIAHFLNPAVWLAGWALDELREAACDDAALAASLCNRLSCGEALLAIVAEARVAAPLPRTALSMSTAHTMLRWRLRRLLDPSRPARLGLSWRAAAALSLVAAVMLPYLKAEPPTESPAAANGKQEGNTARQGADDSTTSAEFSGTIHTASGKPLPGARVYIDAAAPLDPHKPFGAELTRDLGRFAETDAQGRFKLGGLAGDLMYVLLIVARDHRPKQLEPREPRRLDLELTPRTALPADAAQTLRGRVWAPDGQPLAGAIVRARGHQTAEDVKLPRHRFYLPKGMDVAAITDASGDFVLSGDEPISTLDVEIRSPAAVRQQFNFLATGPEQVELPLTAGAKVTGRVMHEGQPVGGVGVLLVPNQHARDFHDPHGPTNTLAAVADSDGRFEFKHVPPELPWTVTTQMRSLQARNLTAQDRGVASPPDGQTLDLNEVNLLSAYRVSGRIVLADGKPLAPKAQVWLYRYQMGDGQGVPIDENGRFSFTGVPPAAVELHIRDRPAGYRISADNASLDPFMLNRLIGKIDGDTEIEIVLEPGEYPPLTTSEGRNADLRKQHELTKQPLRGIMEMKAAK